MFGLNIGEIAVIVIIALIVFGPKKLPQIGKSVGRALNEFKKASSDLSEEFQKELKGDAENKKDDDSDADPEDK